MIKEPHINLSILVMALSKAMDLVSSSVVHHQIRVAYLAFNLALELGLKLEVQKELLLAGALHDCGALSLQEKLEAMRFEINSPYRHAELGYRLLRRFKPFTHVAEITRYHHIPWQNGRGSEFKGKPVPLSSHILHLADRVEVLIDKKREVLGQIEKVCEKIKEQSGSKFKPEVVEAFLGLASREFFWLDITQSTGFDLAQKVKLAPVELDFEGLFSVANLFSQMVDFKSRFTATHSSGVAAVAEILAKLLGFSKWHCRMMRIAGYFHDLGKLAVPAEILEKKGKLSKEEFNIIRAHTYHTYSILEIFDNLELINAWASLHHERMDGKGYPFHIKGEDMLLGSRIMAVADVFTALTEDRPYRKGMTGEEALKEVQRMTKDSPLDPYVVSTLKAHYQEADTLRIAAQKEELQDYEQFHSQPELR